MHARPVAGQFAIQADFDALLPNHVLDGFEQNPVTLYSDLVWIMHDRPPTPEVRMRHALVAILLAATPLAAYAQTYGPPAPAVTAINREVWASFDEQDTQYKEFFPASVPGHDRETGWTPGVGIGARWMGTMLNIPNVYTAIDFHHQSGSVRYVGVYFATDSPLTGTVGLTTDDVTGELGRGFLLTPSVLLTPVLQAGYHTWHRTITSTEIENYGHTELGVALRLDGAITPRLVGTMHLGIAGMLQPNIDIHFHGNYPLGLGSSAIEQAGAKLDYRLTPNLHLFTAADLTHFSYGASKDTPYSQGGFIFEPDSATSHVVLSAGVGWGF